MHKNPPQRPNPSLLSLSNSPDETDGSFSCDDGALEPRGGKQASLFGVKRPEHKRRGQSNV